MKTFTPLLYDPKQGKNLFKYLNKLGFALLHHIICVICIKHIDHKGRIFANVQSDFTMSYNSGKITCEILLFEISSFLIEVNQK